MKTCKDQKFRSAAESDLADRASTYRYESNEERASNLASKLDRQKSRANNRKLWYKQLKNKKEKSKI